MIWAICNLGLWANIKVTRFIDAKDRALSLTLGTPGRSCEDRDDHGCR
jgi:hypothetical protein